MKRPTNLARMALAVIGAAVLVAAMLVAGGAEAPAAAAPAGSSARTAAVPPPSHAIASVAAQQAGGATPTRVSSAAVPQTAARPSSVPARDPAVGYRNPDAGLGLAPPTPTKVAPAAQAAPATSITTSFNGVDIGQTSGFPPDISAAPGASDVVQTANEGFGIFTQSGSEQYHTSFQSWFNNNGNLFDPHVIFDQRGQRYAFVVDDGTHWLLSVAQQTAGLGSWCNYTLSAVDASGHFADFPQIGVDSRYIYLSIVDYPSEDSGDPSDSRLLAISRTQTEACQTAGTLLWTGIRDPGTAGCPIFCSDQLSFRISPANAYDSLDNFGWFADAYPNGGSHVTVFYVDSANTLHSQQVSTPSYTKPQPASQKGTGNILDTGQPNITGLNKTAGELYLALTSGYDWGNGNNNSVVEWMQIEATAGSIGLDKSGAFGFPGLWYFYPSSSGTAPAGFGQVFDFAVSGSTVYPSNAVGAIDNAGNNLGLFYDAQGTGAWSQDPATFCGATCYRWGDFTSTYLDDNDFSHWWTAGMWGAAGNTWSSRISRITM